MTYQVLARKWRPNSFDSLIGQSHVVRALTNALDQQRLHHAYLFTGTRGVGKTTLGRILAKCLNCEQGISSKPCNTCRSCHEIAGGCSIDLIEVDAATRTKVEDTRRELLEDVPYAPASGRFKIYLIDEVHMLSTHSFNALLKTLEEPPAHVKFFLATTDPQKLPITVLSRCLQFHLKHLSQEHITQRLAYVLQQEQVHYEEAALPRLAHAAAGSMRDALSLLDQGIAFGGGQVLTQDVKLMLGTIEDTHIYDILDALAHKQAQKLITITQTIVEKSIDCKNALEELLSFLHQIAIAQFASPIEVGLWDSAKIAHYAQTFSPADIQLLYQIALIGRKDLPLAPTARIGLEMTLLRMLAFQPTQNEHFPAIATLPTSRVTSAPLPLTPPVAIPTAEDHDWQVILPKLNLNGMTAAIAKYCTLKAVTAQEVILAIDPTQRLLLNKKQEERLREALQGYFQRPLRLIIESGDVKMNTPAFKDQQTKKHLQSVAEAAIQHDPNVKKLIETFDATILPDSIVPPG